MLNKFNELCEKHSQTIQEFVPYKGKKEDIFLVEHFLEREPLSKLSTLISEGVQFKSVNITTKEVLNSLGINYDTNEEFYISDKATPHTKPAIIPI